MLVLRFDFHGTGDSAGTYTDVDRVNAWRNSVTDSVKYLESLGLSRIVLAGMRFGATLAMLECAKHASVTHLILWDPVISGKKYIRELKVLSGSAAAAQPAATDSRSAHAVNSETIPGDDALAVGGTVHTGSTLAEIGKVDLLTCEVSPHLKYVLIIQRSDRPVSSKLEKVFLDKNIQTKSVALEGTDGVLDRATEEVTIPREIMDFIVNELATAFAENGADARPFAFHTKEASSAISEWNGTRIQEQFVRIGPAALHGVLCTVAGTVTPQKLVIFLNSGTEHHLGPGRVWVEFGRGLTVEGVDTLRVDFSGIGESRHVGSPRQIRPYDAEQIEDIQNMVKYARHLGYARVAVLGLCAGAWLALDSSLSAPSICRPDAVVAINPQVYWRRGDPTPIAISKFRKPNAAEWEAWGKKWHIWSLLDSIGLKAHSAVRLTKLCKAGVSVLTIFSEGDPGLIYFKNRIWSSVCKLIQKKSLTLVEVKGIDHAMHQYHKRPKMFEAIIQFVAGI